MNICTSPVMSAILLSGIYLKHTGNNVENNLFKTDYQGTCESISLNKLLYIHPGQWWATISVFCINDLWDTWISENNRVGGLTTAAQLVGRPLAKCRVAISTPDPGTCLGSVSSQRVYGRQPVNVCHPVFLPLFTSL